MKIWKIKCLLKILKHRSLSLPIPFRRASGEGEGGLGEKQAASIK